MLSHGWIIIKKKKNQMRVVGGYVSTTFCVWLATHQSANSVGWSLGPAEHHWLGWCRGSIESSPLIPLIGSTDDARHETLSRCRACAASTASTHPPPLPTPLLDARRRSSMDPLLSFPLSVISVLTFCERWASPHWLKEFGGMAPPINSWHS